MFCHKSFSFRVDCNKGRSSNRRKLPPPVGATPLPPEATSLQCKFTTIIHFLPFRVYFYESNMYAFTLQSCQMAISAPYFLPFRIPEKANELFGWCVLCFCSDEHGQKALCYLPECIVPNRLVNDVPCRPLCEGPFHQTILNNCHEDTKRHHNSASPPSPIAIIALIVGATLSQPLLSTSPPLSLPTSVVRYFLMSHIRS